MLIRGQTQYSLDPRNSTRSHRATTPQVMRIVKGPGLQALQGMSASKPHEKENKEIQKYLTHRRHSREVLNNFNEGKSYTEQPVRHAA